MGGRGGQYYYKQGMIRDQYGPLNSAGSSSDKWLGADTFAKKNGKVKVKNKEMGEIVSMVKKENSTKIKDKTKGDTKYKMSDYKANELVQKGKLSDKESLKQFSKGSPDSDSKSKSPKSINLADKRVIPKKAYTSKKGETIQLETIRSKWKIENVKVKIDKNGNTTVTGKDGKVYNVKLIYAGETSSGIKKFTTGAKVTDSERILKQNSNRQGTRDANYGAAQQKISKYQQTGDRIEESKIKRQEEREYHHMYSNNK